MSHPPQGQARAQKVSLEAMLADDQAIIIRFLAQDPRGGRLHHVRAVGATVIPETPLVSFRYVCLSVSSRPRGISTTPRITQREMNQ
jgi:hypothetical protein